MIRLFLGNVGSGKTISVIKEMVENQENPHFPITFSNIKTNELNNILITREMLISKEVTGHKKNGEEICKLKFNKDFWIEQKEKHGAFNIVIDEAHTLFNSRTPNKRINIVLSEFLSLIRKIAQDPVGKCHLTLISQMARRLDVNAREMATLVKYHVCVYDKVCKECGTRLLEHNEMPEPCARCINCGSYEMIKTNHRLIVWHFKNIDDFLDWHLMGEKKFYKILKIHDIKIFFKLYDTLQLDNLISED